MATNSSNQRQDILWVPVENLLLDHANPRLSSGTGSDQEVLLKEMYERYHLNDLIWSLADNGYFSEEPLIAVEAGTNSKGEKIYTIVEGNRRLAALKILLFDKERKLAGAEGLPQLSPEILAKLNPVPVKVYPSRNEIVPYLGVRHILGVRPWGSLSKARYIKQLKEGGSSIEEIKSKVGIRRGDVVQRWLLSLYVLEQANEVADEPWHETEDFYFSFLYTALGYSNVRQYIQLTPGSYEKPEPHPVPAEARENLISHMVDLYGKPRQPSQRKVIESRQIKQLAAVYGSPDALSALRSGYSLEDAYRKAGGEALELADHLRNAGRELAYANALAPHHKGELEPLKFAKRCWEAAKALYETLGGQSSAS
jgi:hypothetical protein